jgi:hypothetical protein
MRGSSAGESIVAARGITIHALFDQKSYHLESFQRAYAWERPQVERLIEDLAGTFLDQWDPRDGDDDVDRYDTYFLGPIIIYRKDDKIHLADGQQRVITLLLLLLQLHRLIEDREDAHDQMAELRTLIRGDRRFGLAFAVRIETYRSCFDALLQRQPFSTDGARPDVQRAWHASQYIFDACPADLRGEAMLPFIRWVLDRVSLVELDAGGPKRGKAMFVAMNDRGVRLAPLDHLKSFMLTDAPDEQDRLDTQWQRMIASLEAIDKDAPLDYVRTVLRSRYFDVDPTEESAWARNETPHEWLDMHKDEIWPAAKKGAPARLFTDLLEPMHVPYGHLLRACIDYTSELEAVWCNALNGLTRQFDLTMAAVRPTDSAPAIFRKARCVANFIDLFVITRGVNEESYAQSELDQVVNRLLPAARESRTVECLRELLGAEAAAWYPKLAAVTELRYRESVNRPFVVYLLARLTAWLECGTGRGDPTPRLLAEVSDQRPYEVEHLFTKRAGAYGVADPDSTPFQRVRARIGALVLLDGAENASLGGGLLAEKTGAYRAANWLAASLHPDSYGRGSVKFRDFAKKENLIGMFRHYQDNEPIEGLIEERGLLYRAIAERVWAPEALGLLIPVAEAATGAPEPARRSRRRSDVSLSDLVLAGRLLPDSALVGRRRGKLHRATLLANGKIRIATGGQHITPSKAAMEAAESSSENGWTFWRVEDTGETLGAVRDRFRPLKQVGNPTLVD